MQHTQHVKINCIGHTICELKDLIFFGKNLKFSKPIHKEKLKINIINYGLLLPFVIYIDQEKKYLIDGYQRFIALKSLEKDGYILPQNFPMNLIKISKEKLLHVILSLSSQYSILDPYSIGEFIYKNNGNTQILDDIFIHNINYKEVETHIMNIKNNLIVDCTPPKPHKQKT